MAVSKLGASSRFNLILFLYGSIVFYSFLCLVLFVYLGCFNMAGLNLASSSHFKLVVLFVYGSIVFNSFFCFLLCVYCVCCFGMPAGLDLGTFRFNLLQYFHPSSYFTFKTQQNQNHHSDRDDDDDDEEGRDLVPENKLKPRPPVIIRESPNSLRSILLEVSNGCDVLESIAKYALKRQRGINISSGSGTVRNVSLRQPAGPAAGDQVVTLHGTFEILSLSGSILPQPAPLSATSLTIFLAVGQGQVVGGAVVGELMALGPVTLVASSFSSVSYERIPLEEEEEEEETPDEVVQVGCTV